MPYESKQSQEVFNVLIFFVTNIRITELERGGQVYTASLLAGAGAASKWNGSTILPLLTTA